VLAILANLAFIDQAFARSPDDAMSLYVKTCKDPTKASLLQSYAFHSVRSMYDWPYYFDVQTLIDEVFIDTPRPCLAPTDMDDCKALWQTKVDEIRDEDIPFHAWIKEFACKQQPARFLHELHMNARNVRDIMFAAIVLKPRFVTECGEEGFCLFAKHMVCPLVLDTTSLVFYLFRALPRSTLRLQSGQQYELPACEVTNNVQLIIRPAGRGRARLVLEGNLTFEGTVIMSNLDVCRASTRGEARTTLACHGITNSPNAEFWNLRLEGVELHMERLRTATCTGVTIRGAENGLNAHYIDELRLTACQVSSGGSGVFGTFIENLVVDELILNNNRARPIQCFVTKTCDIKDLTFAQNQLSGVIRMPGPSDTVLTVSREMAEGTHIGRTGPVKDMSSAYVREAYRLYAYRDHRYEGKPIPENAFSYFYPPREGAGTSNVFEHASPTEPRPPADEPTVASSPVEPNPTVAAHAEVLLIATHSLVDRLRESTRTSGQSLTHVLGQLSIGEKAMKALVLSPMKLEEAKKVKRDEPAEDAPSPKRACHGLMEKGRAAEA